jgi:hypothetical protein
MLSLAALATLLIAQSASSGEWAVGQAAVPSGIAAEQTLAVPSGFPAVGQANVPSGSAAEQTLAVPSGFPAVGQANVPSGSAAEQALAVPSGFPAEQTTALPVAPEFMTRDEVSAEIKNSCWTKGNFRITPYGTLWGNMAYDSQRAKVGEYCLWIESPSMHFQEPDYSVDARSTRLGLDLIGPGIPCLHDAKITGKVEVDFQGIFVTRNKPGLLLRHAYFEAKDDEFRLLIGQTWDVISPLYIPTLNYTAGSAVGNLAYRRAQFRAERYQAFSDNSMLTLQGSLNANVVTDFVGETETSADIGPYPDVQARAAITLGQRTGPDAMPIVFGISGHCGEQDFDFRSASNTDLGVERPTWSVNADVYIPITARLGFQAEFFTGENLSNYMGGILQGVDRNTHRGIHATGGWADIWFKWLPNLCSHTGYALDDPANNDITTATGRTYNQMIFANMLYDATENLQVGMEVDVWRTFYKALEPGEAVRLECAVKYRF